MFRLLVIASLLALSNQSDAQFVVIEKAYEVRLSDFQVPSSSYRKAVFRGCESCEQQSIQVADSTRWVIDGITVSLDVFRKRTGKVANRDRTALMVMHHLKNNYITRVEISLR